LLSLNCWLILFLQPTHAFFLLFPFPVITVQQIGVRNKLEV